LDEVAAIHDSDFPRGVPTKSTKSTKIAGVPPTQSLNRTAPPAALRASFHPVTAFSIDV
jgi:hypothetical protein